MEKANRKRKNGRGGARKGAGRKPRPGWRERSISLQAVNWRRLGALLKERRAQGQKNVSVSTIADEIISAFFES